MVDEKLKTKIICTIGPATDSPEMIQRLIESGMNVARLNMSHGDEAGHTAAVRLIRASAKRVGAPVAVMVDVPGPKYRTGLLADGVLTLQADDEIVLTSRDVVGTSEVVAVAPYGIHNDARPGSPLLLDDGRMKLDVQRVDGEDVYCTVVHGGRLTQGRGVGVPGRTPMQAFPSEPAVRALKFAAECHADFAALSMVSSKADVEAARAVLQDHGHEPSVVSKIELSGAVERFEEILDVSDGIMVARGDMGVEMPIAKVPMIQKSLISLCNERGKPAITATQMLESMVKSPVPTRAEVTDVANAIFDGTDAIMLSGETANGDHPIEALQVMAEVAKVAEDSLPYRRLLAERQEYAENKVDDAIAYNACHTAQQLGSKVIVAFTESGSTAQRVSKYRPKAHVIALTTNEEVQRRLMLAWGVTPFVVHSIEQVDGFFNLASQYAREQGGVTEGGSVVLVAGLPIGVPGGTNLLRVLSLN